MIESKKELIEKLKKYKKIVVTGPQRSGTTFFSNSLSKELGFRNIDERKYKVHIEDLFLKELKSENIVIQAPAMSHMIHLLEKDKSVCIVFIFRDDEEIINSEKRIKWDVNHFQTEKNKYINMFGVGIRKYKKNCKMKKYVWNFIQKKQLKNDHLEVCHSILKEFNGFLDKKERKNFRPKQISKK
jgi:hypothetical protein